ncbi:MAG: Trm112 family protein [Pseudomonadota bacterium]
MDKRLLTILCCPVTHKGLSVAKADALSQLNDAISGGSARNRSGATLETVVSEALVTDDGKLLYPVVNGIPVLLEGEAINVESL